jgi:hypothetical protein
MASRNWAATWSLPSAQVSAAVAHSTKIENSVQPKPLQVADVHNSCRNEGTVKFAMKGTVAILLAHRGDCVKFTGMM